MEKAGQNADEPESDQPSSRATRFRTEDACHCEQPGVRMCLRFSSAAMAARDPMPAPRMSSKAPLSPSAKALAFALFAATEAPLPFAARRKGAAPFGLPSLTPRAFAAARAAFVRSDMRS